MQQAAEAEPAQAIDAAKLRARILGNRVPLQVLAAAIGVCTRTIYGYCEAGLPYLPLAGERWFDVDETLNWLTRRTKRRPKENQQLPLPRGPGRPRKIFK